MFDRHWHQKPPRGTQLNLEHPLTRGLASFFPLWEGEGPPADVVSGRAASSNTVPWGGSSKGWALFGAGGDTCIVANGSSPLNITGPITIAALARPQTGFNGQTLYSTGYNASMFSVDTYSGVLAINYGNSASSGRSNFLTPDGNWHTFAISQGSATGAVFYFDGYSVGTASYSGYAPSYTGNRSILANDDGSYPFYGPIAWIGFWNRALSGPEHILLATDPWQIFGTRNTVAAIPQIIVPGFSVSAPAVLYAGNPSTTLSLLGFDTNWSGGTTFTVSGVAGTSKSSQAVIDINHATVAVSTGAAAGTLTISDGTESATFPVTPQSIAAVPYTVPAHHTGHIAITLTGSGTRWTTGTTTFSVSGVSGVSIVGQSIASMTLATLTIATGSGTGTLAITDGTSTVPVTVATAGLAASPNPVAATGLITLTGTSTVWTQETAASLFTASGVSGAGLSGITVQSDTQATALLAASTATGTITIIDNSAGATATATADALPAGSLHLGTPLLVGPSSSSTLFGNRAAATLAFRFKVNSNAGLNSTGGTQVVAWGTNANGGQPLAVYYPASGQLTITAYGGNNSGYYVDAFTTSIPIQRGVGYHILISWGATPQLYVNGLLYATAGFSNVATFPYQQVRVGGNAGVGIATDHAVSDICIWNAYAATSSDALGLATAASSPLQVGGTQPGTSCSAWWPLGGGTVGSTPSLSDQWFGDYSANGNTLSVVAGTLPGGTYAAGIGLGSPSLVSGWVPKCGKLAIFGATSSVAAGNGGYPVAPITAVGGTPAISRNGTPVSIGPATWFSTDQDTPFVAYLLQCGSVQAISNVLPGSNYTNPTVTASGGGGSGATFGTPVLKTGVTGYTILNGGSFSGTPAVSVAPPSNDSGPQGGTAATARATVSGGTLATVVPACGGILGCGQGYSAGSLPTVTIGPGSGAQLTPVVSGGKITAINVPYGYSGSGYPSAVQINIWDSTGTGATATATMTGTGGPGPNNYGILSVAVGGSGGSGYTNPIITVAPTGKTACVQPILSTYIASVPVANGGSGYTSLPTIAVSDPTGTGATFVPIMSGVSPGDAMTYGAPAAWITPSIGGQQLGGLQAVSGAHMDNWTGQREGASGGFAAFAQTPTMLAGVNVGEQPTNYALLPFTAKNRLHQGGGWGASGGGSLSSANGIPVSWTSPATTIIQDSLYGPSGPNYVDNSGWPDQAGQWTVEYDDSQANTPAASAFWLYCQSQLGYSYMTVTPVNLSGPHTGRTTGAVNTGTVSYTYGGGLTGITPGGLGSGYSGATVVISGGGGSGAIATAMVAGGVIESFHIVCPGTGYSSAPTVTVYGTTLSGTTITAVIDIAYSGANPPIWTLNIVAAVAAPANNTGGNDGKAYWTIGNPWIVAPNAATGLAVASIDRTKALATDDNAIQALTTPSGKVPGVLRFMDVTQGYGGISNFVYGADLMNPNQPGWQGQTTLSPTFQFVRYWNTNPSSTTYTWSSTKVYGPQAYFVETDAPFAITGTTTSGSTSVTGIATGLMVGSAISGPGIPSGTIIVGLRSSGATAILSQAATASGAGVTLTVTNPGYIPLPPGDNGYFANNNYGSQSWAVWELRSTTPHGLSTGQVVTLNSNNNVLPLTNLGNWNPNGGTTSPIWVTGPYTIATTGYVGGSAPASSRAQTVNSTTEINYSGGQGGGWSSAMVLPYSNHCVPYEYSAAMAAQLPGSGLWVNIPHPASDNLIAAIAQKIAANIGPSNIIYVEHGNENWNGAFPYYLWYWNLSTLLGYIPQGRTAINYYTSTGGALPYDAYGPATLLSAHSHDAFIAAWTAAGQDPSRVRRVMGSWWNGPFRTQDVVAAAGQWGFQFEHIAIAPYYTLPNDSPVVVAHTPAGTSYANAGNWPVDALNDLNRHWITYNSTNQSYWSQHAQYTQAYGQPVASVNFTDSNAIANAFLSPTSIASVSIVSGGSGYTGPSVTFNGGGGTGATGTAAVSGGVIIGITITNGGSGYTSGPVVSLSDPNGSGFAAGVLLTPTSVASLSITSQGVGYRSAPQAVITNQDGRGSGASATATINGSGQVTGFTNLVGGSGYTTTPKVTITGGGGGLAAGQYYACFTYVDYQGNETTIGLSRVGWIAIGPGDIPTFSMPTWPSWAASMNIYLSPPYGVPGTEVFYMNVPRSAYGTTYPVGAPIPLNAAIPSPGTRKPPATNQAAANISNPPSLITYEGGVQTGVPFGVPYSDQLFHDTFAHPSQRDLIWGWYASCQLGNQSQAGSGAVLATYYQLYNGPNYPYTWQLAYGCGQPPGDGTSNAYLGSSAYTVPANRFATTQGGLPADNHDHNGGPTPNTSPALQGFRDWFEASSPLPVQPTPTGRGGRNRRWFAGLAQNAMRLGR